MKNRKSIYIILLLILIVIINIFFQKLGKIINLKFDFTTNSLYSISEETVNIVSKLDNSVTIFYIKPTDNDITEISRLLTEYSKVSDKITVKYINPATDFLFIDKYELLDVPIKLNSIIVESETNRYVLQLEDMYNFSTDGTKVLFSGESKLTNAIVNVSNPNKSIIGYAQGHGEDSPSILTALLLESGYTTSSLIFNKPIPEDIDVLLILSPKSDYTDHEIKILDEYLSKGGSIVFFKHTFSDNLVKLYSYLSEWGIKFNEDLVLDYNNNILDNSSYVISQFYQHEINNYFKNNSYYVVVPSANSISKDFSNNTNSDVLPVLSSSDNAYSRSQQDIYKDFDNQIYSSTQVPNANDEKGSFVLAATSSRNYNNGKIGKIFACGSHRMYYDNLLGLNSVANSRFFIEILKWGIQSKQDSLPILGKEIGSMPITVSTVQINLLTFLLVFAIPICILLYGVINNYKRRQL